MPKKLPDHCPGQLNGKQWGCPKAPADQCGWWLVAAPSPSPSHPSDQTPAEKGPGSPAWFPGLAVFGRWTGWGPGVALV